MPGQAKNPAMPFGIATLIDLSTKADNTQPSRVEVGCESALSNKTLLFMVKLKSVQSSLSAGLPGMTPYLSSAFVSITIEPPPVEDRAERAPGNENGEN